MTQSTVAGEFVDAPTDARVVDPLQGRIQGLPHDPGRMARHAPHLPLVSNPGQRVLILGDQRHGSEYQCGRDDCETKSSEHVFLL